MASVAQAERLFWMDGIMRSGGYLHWQTVAEKFEVQRRTVFNDKRFLTDRLGAPIKFSQRGNGWYYTDPNYQLPFLALSEPEADTLHRTLLAALASLPPADKAAAQRLALRLSPYVRRLPVHGGTLPATSEIFLNGQPTLAPHLTITDALLADVRRATDLHHRLDLTYYSAHSNSVTRRTVQPYLLLNRGGELYLIAHCELRGDTRDFGLHRIREYAVLEPSGAFTVPPTFDPVAYLETAFELQRGQPLVTVRVKFSIRQSAWIKERIYHPTQILTEEADGSVIVSLRVSGTAEAKRWVLSFGESAEVLEPESLRVDVANEVIYMNTLYNRWC